MGVEAISSVPKKVTELAGRTGKAAAEKFPKVIKPVGRVIKSGAERAGSAATNAGKESAPIRVVKLGGERGTPTIKKPETKLPGGKQPKDYGGRETAIGARLKEGKNVTGSEKSATPKPRGEKPPGWNSRRTLRPESPSTPHNAEPKNPTGTGKDARNGSSKGPKESGTTLNGEPVRPPGPTRPEPSRPGEGRNRETGRKRRIENRNAKTTRLLNQMEADIKKTDGGHPLHEKLIKEERAKIDSLNNGEAKRRDLANARRYYKNAKSFQGGRKTQQIMRANELMENRRERMTGQPKRARITELRGIDKRGNAHTKHSREAIERARKWGEPKWKGVDRSEKIQQLKQVRTVRNDYKEVQDQRDDLQAQWKQLSQVPIRERDRRWKRQRNQLRQSLKSNRHQISASRRGLRSARKEAFAGNGAIIKTASKLIF